MPNEQESERTEDSQSSATEQDTDDGTETSEQDVEESEGLPEAEAEEAEEEAPLPFTDPRLRGRTPEEIQRLFQLQQSAVDELGNKVTELTETIKRSAVPKPAPEDPDVTRERFFTNPKEVLRETFEEMVAPIREELRRANTPDAWAALRQWRKDADQYEGDIRAMLRANNELNADDPRVLANLYLLAKGRAADEGRLPISNVKAPSQPDRGNVKRAERKEAAARLGAPRQERPSPPEKKTPSAAPKRALTEVEKRLAREYNMTDSEYLDMQADFVDSPSKFGPSFSTYREGN